MSKMQAIKIKDFNVFLDKFQYFDKELRRVGELEPEDAQNISPGTKLINILVLQWFLDALTEPLRKRVLYIAPKTVSDAIGIIRRMAQQTLYQPRVKHFNPMGLDFSADNSRTSIVFGNSEQENNIDSVVLATSAPLMSSHEASEERSNYEPAGASEQSELSLNHSSPELQETGNKATRRDRVLETASTSLCDGRQKLHSPKRSSNQRFLDYRAFLKQNIPKYRQEAPTATYREALRAVSILWNEKKALEKSTNI